MEVSFGEFEISDDRERISLDRVEELLRESYWAAKRSREAIEESIHNSLCLGVYEGAKLVGFARIVTDLVTIYWLCDLIIDPAYRGRGLGKKLTESVVGLEQLQGLAGILATRDAHGLYAQFGFSLDPERLMWRHPEVRNPALPGPD
jgi:GNAT superfamily N-acetyltransferase